MSISPIHCVSAFARQLFVIRPAFLLSLLLINGALAESGAQAWQVAPTADQGRIGAQGKFTPRDDPSRSKASTGMPPLVLPSSREEAEAALGKAIQLIPLDEHRFRLGRVEFNRQKKIISFPAKIEKRSGPIEYALVGARGKVHESLLSTTVSPKNVHLAALLLGVEPQVPQAGPQGGLQVPKEAALEVRVSWRKNGPDADWPLTSLILLADEDQLDDERKLAMHSEAPIRLKSMPAFKLWCYNGSRLTNGRFVAEHEGSLIALMSDGSALINNPQPNRRRDDLFRPHSQRLPADGVPVTVTLIVQP